MTFTLFAEFPNIKVIAGFPEPIAIDVVAPKWCYECGVYVTPFFDSDHDVWIEPCHSYKCGKCGSWESETSWCEALSIETCDDCWELIADYDDDDCDCANCKPHHQNYSGVRPEWERSDLSLSDSFAKKTSQVTRIITDEVMTINPQAMMAEFYVCDYVMARIAMTYRHGLSAWNAGHRRAYELRADAKRHQDHIVAMCDPIFRDYLLMAIGGELRHHYGVSMPSGRSSSWEWFVAMAYEHGRARMVSAAVELYGDERGWTSGYGGAKWRVIAEVLLARENGSIDAKTFVDRVFSLQHNGGSALDKVDWGTKTPTFGGTHRMVEIGNAHAATVIDFPTLIRWCRESTIRDLLFDANGFVRMSEIGMPESERDEWQNAIKRALKELKIGSDDLPVLQCSGKQVNDGYAYHDGQYCEFHSSSVNNYYFDDVPKKWFKSS